MATRANPFYDALKANHHHFQIDDVVHLFQSVSEERVDKYFPIQV